MFTKITYFRLIIKPVIYFLNRMLSWLTFKVQWNNERTFAIRSFFLYVSFKFDDQFAPVWHDHKHTYENTKTVSMDKTILKSCNGKNLKEEKKLFIILYIFSHLVYTNRQQHHKCKKTRNPEILCIKLFEYTSHILENIYMYTFVSSPLPTHIHPIIIIFFLIFVKLFDNIVYILFMKKTQTTLFI